MYTNASIREATSGTSFKSGFRESIGQPTLKVKKGSFSHVNDIVGLEGPLYLQNKAQHHQLVSKRADLAKNLLKQQQALYATFSEYENIGKRAESLGRMSLDYGHGSARAQ